MRRYSAKLLRYLALWLSPEQTVTIHVDSAPIVARIDQLVTDALETGFIWTWPKRPA